MMQYHRPNRLIQEKSPYLLQHAYNPVDWYPWGEEAFQKALETDKPIFLSVGYSTCYWCHVMEREVFENESIARLLNETFVCIKVDREERPDVDRVYMAAVQAIAGNGGWPMSLFLTPDLKPFHAGTYIPPVSQHGRPGMVDIINQIGELWRTQRDKITQSGETITELIRSASSSSAQKSVDNSVMDAAYRHLQQTYDSLYGGFGNRQKFPRPVTFSFLFRYYARTGAREALDMALKTLRAMARGGIHDHIGGGFHRYSVDPQWRVPHFEKMLYDQAQLIVSYIEAYQITHDEEFAQVAHDILNYVIGNMQNKEGGFLSAEDAESAIDPTKPEEKEEGAFYLWTKEEIDRILDTHTSGIFCNAFGVESNGNAPHDPQQVFVGKNILYAAHSLEESARYFKKSTEEIQKVLTTARWKLFCEREKRPHPHLDDKVITAWNGLMISAFAKAYQVFGEERFLKGATSAADFVLTNLFDPERQILRRRWRDGEARFDGTLQDYALFVQGLLDLYETSFEFQWLDKAIDLTKRQIEIFWDEAHGGFFDTAGTDPSILIRTKEDYDGAEPAGNSIVALNLLRLAHITNSSDWRAKAEQTIQSFGSRLNQMPDAVPQMLVALDWLCSTPTEIIIAGEGERKDTRTLLREVNARFIPRRILLLADGSEQSQALTSLLPFTRDMKPLDGKATAYVCENFACKLPTSDAVILATLLKPQ